VVACPAGLTDPPTVAAVVLVGVTDEVLAPGAPAVNGCGKPVEVADALVALIAAQYLVPLVSPAEHDELVLAALSTD